MPEPEPELQATANLSPVSPAPLHTAPALAVPQLQETVDTIDAMVAAALAPNGAVTEGEPVVDPELLPTGDDENDDVVDDDSFNEAYAEDNATTDATSAPQPTTQPEDDGDDYAKTFDSPIGSEAGDENEEPGSAGDEAQQPPTTTSDSLAEGSSTATANAERPQEQRPAEKTQASSDSTEPADDSVADIQQLVADLTSHPVETSVATDANPTQPTAETVEPSSTLPSSALPSSASLPPRPPISHNTQSYPEKHHPGQPTPSVPGTSITQAAQAPGTYPAALPNVLPGTGSLPPHPSPGLVAPGQPHAPPSYPAHAPGYSSDMPAEDDYQRKWDQFLADERQYMSEAKWDRFPDGSRIFIGNLSSDKVSKRDVFDMFHRFGKLAQISLKSAYGFVQYHTVEEGRAAVDNLEGIEIKGRRIHLEISRAQDKGKKDRGRSPDKGRGRERDSRRGERFNQGRDEYRSGRDASPGRNDYRGRDDQYGRNRNSYDGGRNRRRSRSPDYHRQEKDPYRRRSPSPYSRSRGEEDIDLPRRYGADVPDVQIILEPNVHRDFANWVEMTFKGKGLQTEVMFLHPRIPKEQVIQRQAAEGVHAVVDLDLRAQSLSKVPVKAFDRSQGLNNVRFEQYVDLDPPTAAEVILRAKASGAAKYGQQQYGGYTQPYGGQQPPPAPGYGPPQSHGYPQPPPPQQQPANNPADIAALMSQVDPATLQRLLATMQAPNQSGAPAPAAPAPNGGLDLQAILGSLGGQQPAAPQPPAPQPQYGAGYGAQHAAQQQPPAGAPAGNGDSAAQVQNIMAQLARYR
ncbi:RNA recognition motif domain-containing protein [Sarocladium implicatum]|nr:RNA recognition motif domain-containing protein [Sarocladium implicatum]